ncbi:hypothetical protein K461DRAFT_265871 [Myriangium duriaei CBS 260.36]|uniref:Rhodopsin domain-containing protein n=1 Tax=Myriangium duriaei CBS 260.36 TaxID=1168546 RepID=A0A9P4MKQ5_9PEZI|nr:hypothetical protein K461DRAFT_265871 [Myriangium duriaei CBS 260.36]
MMSEADKEIAAYGLKPDAYLAESIVSLFLVTIAVSLRIYVRTIVTKSFGLDDWFLLAAWVLFVADAYTAIKVAVIVKKYGVVAHLLEMTAHDFASMLLYLVNQALLKVSMALFFLRIPQRKWQIWVIRISMAVYCTYSFAFFFVVLFECGSPTGFNFIYGTCFAWNIMGPLNYIAAVLNAIVDWVFIITPLFVVWHTMMSRRSRIQICLLIAFGAMGSIVSIARIPLIKDLRIFHSLKYFGKIVPISLLSLVETGVGLIAISLAALRPLMKRRKKTPYNTNEEESHLRRRSDAHEFGSKSFEMSSHVVHITAERTV